MNPLVSQLLLQLSHGGKIYSNKKWNTRWINFVPASDLPVFASILNAKDLLILADPSEELLVSMNQITAAQLAMVGSKTFAMGLVDFSVPVSQFENALKELEATAKKQMAIAKPSADRKALFLDRDGVIIENIDYNRWPEKVKLLRGIADVIKKAHALDCLVVVVTNQSGISRQHLTWEQYHKVTFRMQQLLADQGVWVDGIFAAPFFNEGESYTTSRHFRKPRTGMFHKARQEFGIELKNSFLIGDSHTDLIAGALSGVPKNFLLGSTDEWSKLQAWPLFGKHAKKISKISELSSSAIF